MLRMCKVVERRFVIGSRGVTSNQQKVIVHWFGIAKVTSKNKGLQ